MKKIILFFSLLMVFATFVGCSKEMTEAELRAKILAEMEAEEALKAEIKAEIEAEMEAEKASNGEDNEDTTSEEVEAYMDYPLYDVSKVMYTTGFEALDIADILDDKTYKANEEHLIATDFGDHTVLFTHSEKELSITIDGEKTMLDEHIPLELIYDEFAIYTDEYEGYEIFQVQYLYRVAPDGINIGLVSPDGSNSGYYLPNDPSRNYPVDDYLNLLGQKESVLMEELGYPADLALDYYDFMHRYLYDRIKFIVYEDEICALIVSGQEIFGRTWETFGESQVHYSEIENFFGAEFEIISEESEFYENVIYNYVDYIKYEYNDYVLYFRLWGNNNDEIGDMIIINKDFMGILDDVTITLFG